MLQRIQTVWLFLASLAILLLFLFPVIQFIDFDGTAKVIKATGLYQNLDGQVVQTHAFIALTIATVVVGLTPLVVIFFYKERKKQISLCYVSILLILAYSFWLAQTAKQEIGTITIQLQNYGIGIILSSLAILFIILALKGIRRDEKLVRSADRLR